MEAMTYKVKPLDTEIYTWFSDTEALEGGNALSGSQYTSLTPPGASIPHLPQTADSAEVP